MADFDTTRECINRADKLVRDAKKKAYSGWKFGPAAKAYFTSETATRILAAAGGGTAITVIAHAAAGALLAAGLVGASAATFGVAPAVGMALTYLLLKGVAEAKYQSSSGKLKGGGVVKKISDEDGEYYVVEDSSMLGPLVAKVLKKYERVKRAAAQAGALGNWAHDKSVLRHMKTAIKGAAKDVRFLREHGIVTSDSRLFPGTEKYKDHELSDRLYELRFYGQMLFNYVETIVDEIAVPKRNGVADCCQFMYSQIIRQVHFTGNHDHCSKCYSPPPDRLNAQVLARIADGSKFRSTIGADKRLAAGNIQKLGAMQGNAVDNLPKANRNDQIATWGFRGAVASTEVMAGVQYLNVDFGDVINKELHHEVLSTSGIADGAGQSALQGAASGAMTSPISVLVAELTRTITNRLTKRSVLEPGRARGAFNLLEEGQDARAEARRAFESLVGTHDAVSRAPRIAEKIIWYKNKLDQIEGQVKMYYAPLTRNLTFERSAFATCDDAYKLVYNVNYFFRNCEKFIAFLVYLEAILIQIDGVVSSIVKLPEGVIIKPGVKNHPKPVTVKEFKAPAKK